MIIRPATVADTAALTALLNQIIGIGGTTAHQTPYTEAKFAAHYISGQAVICCHLAEQDRVLLGYQSLDLNAALAQGWGDIGTFVAPDLQRSGIGAALFAATCAAARAKGITTINATIRADNTPGLGYYARRGFTDYAHDPDWALNDGRIVGRISKRYDL